MLVPYHFCVSCPFVSTSYPDDSSFTITCIVVSLPLFPDAGPLLFSTAATPCRRFGGKSRRIERRQIDTGGFTLQNQLGHGLPTRWCPGNAPAIRSYRDDIDVRKVRALTDRRKRKETHVRRWRDHSPTIVSGIDVGSFIRRNPAHVRQGIGRTGTHGGNRHSSCTRSSSPTFSYRLLML